jgi:hypothetical protein
MSHTSQRRGLSPEDPGRETVVLGVVPARLESKTGVSAAMAELAMKMLAHGPDNWTSRNFTQIRIPGLSSASGLSDGLQQLSPDAAAKLLMRTISGRSSAIAAVYTDLEKIRALLEDLQGEWLEHNRREGLPISIVCSGLFGDVTECCHRTDLTPHTFLHSLGFFGHSEKLPGRRELEIMTMCGHGLVSLGRIRQLVSELRDGTITVTDAADNIAKPCICGIVNRERAAEVIRVLADTS